MTTQNLATHHEPEFVDFKTARRIFGLSRSHLYNLAERGEIKSVSLREPGKIKGKRLFVADSIRNFLIAHIAQPQTGVQS